MEEPDYKDFYICVNGSSKSQLIRASYFIFQLQNIGDVNKQLQNVSNLSHLQPLGREEIDIERDRDRDRIDRDRDIKIDTY